MGIPSRKERRLGSRLSLTGLLPGRLKNGTGEDVNCKPVDISPHGLGIVLNIEFDTGDRFFLAMKDETIDLEVAWVQRDFGKRDLFRYGLVTLNESIDLRELFIKAGCLK